MSSAADPPGKLWGGRFEGAVHPEIESFSRALSFDRRLVRHDLAGCLAHARMLRECSVISQEDAGAVLNGLAAMLAEVEAGALAVEGDDEDVHSWIERTLTERIGTPARRLHTGRSRNDQTATALRLYLRGCMGELVEALVVLLRAFRERAAEHQETPLPGYTHLQRAQPVSLAHHLLAHAWSLEADGQRLSRAHAAAGSSPLGAGALAGTPHPIDPHRSARLLGFERVFVNSMHAVADRDYVLEACFASSLLMVHLSRWAEEVVLWTSSEFGFAMLDDAVAKGSSIMPQKRNPEAAEILRGKSGRAIGDLVALLVQLKGLPLTYNSDLQEDKEAVFDALDTAASALGVALPLLSGLRFSTSRMQAALRGGFVTATDLADLLVLRGAAFRDAHELTGRAVRRAEARGCELWELSAADLGDIGLDLSQQDLGSLEPRASLAAHSTPGGPAPDSVAQQLAAFDRAVEVLSSWTAALEEPPILTAARNGTLLEEKLGCD